MRIDGMARDGLRDWPGAQTLQSAALQQWGEAMAWESPRGPISIDPETREIVQNVYIGKIEKVDGELYNVEFATFDAVKDPLKK